MFRAGVLSKPLCYNLNTFITLEGGYFSSHFASALMRAAAEVAENTLLPPAFPFRSLPRFLLRKVPLALLLVLLMKLASDPLGRDENCPPKLSIPNELASEPLNLEDRGAENPIPALSRAVRPPAAKPWARPKPLSFSTG